MTLALGSQKIQEIARSYSEKGYRVIQEPSAEQLPKFLAGTQPDLIAQSDTDSIVIEVKVGTERAATESYQEIADRVRDQPDWRFRLIIVDPRSEDVLPVDDPVLTLGQIEARLDQLKKLISMEMTNEVVLIGWSVFEALLRLLARREEVPIEQAPVRVLARELYSSGILSVEDFETVESIHRIRNGIAHGFSTHATMDVVEELGQLSERLFVELQKSEE